jgi:hypothetical protein
LKRAALIAVSAALLLLALGAPAAQGDFGFLPGKAGFSASLIADTPGSVEPVPTTRAGSHPYQLDLGVGFNTVAAFNGQAGPFPEGDLRDLRIEMPAGMILNPAALDQCSPADFHTPRSSPFAQTLSGENCPDRTQLGTVDVHTSFGGGQTRRFGLFNLQPAGGVTAELGFSAFGSPIVLDAHLRQGTDGRYVLTLEARDFPQALDVVGLDLHLWGNPWAASHDGERGDCLNEAEPSFPWAKCSVGATRDNHPRAYLTAPTECRSALPFTAVASSWQQPAEVTRMANNEDASGQPVPLGQCANLPFNPFPTGALTTTKTSTSSGYTFLLHQDLSAFTEPGQITPSPVRRVFVRLPEGVTINPSVGAGLLTCSPAQYAAETALSQQGEACPNGAKIGDFRVKLPLFEEAVEGAIYLATPDNPTSAAQGAENPFDSLIAIYLVAKLPARGVLVKLAGNVVPDLATGTLTATFDGLPQLPYTDLELNFRTGQRAFLISPAFCGDAITHTEMTPWSNEATISGIPTFSPIETGIDFGACPTGQAPPFDPAAIAGGVNSNVNSYTPYYVHLSRRDTEQEITSYSLVLPKGITGKLAGIPFCPEGAIEAARHRLGATETASPSCPAASQVGRTLTGYGVGPALTYAPGRIYLAGPYHGSPLSLVTINSATVGPFDLGTIVIRSAFDVDPHTAQLRIDSSASDPIPHIIDGIPLHLREVRVYMDRPQFTHNPSSCEASQLVSRLTGSGASFASRADDSIATVAEHFQLLNCLNLGFRPKLGLRLRGGSRRGAFPSLRASFAARGPQDSNLKKIEVTTPQSLFLAQGHIRTVCTRAQFDERRCPKSSVYGRAVASTPLFDEPLRGNVYLRSSTGRLPDLVADLYSGAIRIVLEGKIGPGRSGGIRTFFDNLPDAPIKRFTMILFGGRRGLLQNSSNICANPPLATVSALGQNNIGAKFGSLLRGQCQNQNKRPHKGRQSDGGRER